MAKTANDRGSMAESSGPKAKSHEVCWMLVIGAALHWASMALALYPIQAAALLRPAHLDELSWLCTALSVPACIAAILGAQAFGRASFRRALAAIGMAGSLAGLAFALFLQPQDAEELGLAAVAYQVCQACSIYPLVLLWGLSFASLDKRSAGANVVLTSALTATLFLLFVAASAYLPACKAIVESLARAGSSVLLAAPRVPFSIKQRQPKPPHRSAFVRFLAARGAVGVAIGLLIGPLVGAQPSWQACTAGALLSAGALVVLSLRRTLLYRISPLMPLMFAGVFTLPVLFAGRTSLADAPNIVGATLCWTCWISVSCFQISGLKESFGMDEAHLCFSEKAVLLSGWLIGLVASGGTPVPIALPVMPNESVRLCLPLMYAVVFWATYASFRTVYSRREDELLGRIEASRCACKEQVYETIGDRFGLTKREVEVMRMLAQGFTRPYICQELGVSDGTARAHAAHVYQKLGVHKKDDLLELVQRVEAELERE